MKKDSWFEERKDLFIKELVCEYLKAAAFFDELFVQYSKEGRIHFQEMDSWVGTELKKGPLWNLKDLSHSLFRDRSSRIGGRELLFDWTLGSIFHECMKLKEDVYQLEAYWPRYQNIEGNGDLLDEIKEILKEYTVVIKKTEKEMKEDVEKIEYLFSKATDQLKKLLPEYSRNGLLIIHLLDNEDSVNRVFGESVLEQTFGSMYHRGYEEALSVAGETLLEGGWYERAIVFFEKALKENPNNTKSREKLKIASKKLKKLLR